MSKEVVVMFSMQFKVRDDQPVEEAVKMWVNTMGVKYVSHREVTDEAMPADITLDDCVDYIVRGTKSPSVKSWLDSLEAQQRVAAEAERLDQHDGAGAHWR